MNIRKFLKKPLWITLTSVFTVLFVGVIVGGVIADSWKKTISDFLDAPTYRIETIESEEEIDAEYYKSNYVQKDEDGNVIYVTDEETGYKHQLYDDLTLHEDGVKFARQVQKEGTTILWNNATGSATQGIPLENGSKVSVFGQTSVMMANSGQGSGQSNSSASTQFKNRLTNAGFSVNNTLWTFYNNNLIKHPTNATAGSAYEKPYKTVFALPWSDYTDSVKNSFASYGDAALIVVTRVSGEYEDCYQTGANTISGDYLGISANEKQVIDEVIKLKKSGTFKKVVMLLNTATSLRFKDFQPYQSDIDACVWIGQGGTQGLYEVADILKGTSIPSGHLPDTYVYDGQSAPAAVNAKAISYTNIPSNSGLDTNRQTKYMTYAEGIYIGYRYYETRYEDAVLGRYNATSTAGAVNSENNWKYSEEVAYPFGYGMAYTTFAYSNFKVEKNADDDNYTVTVTVTNTGEQTGADAVQIYIQKPYTEYDKNNNIEQAAVNLCGFAKTKELEPNEAVPLEIQVKADAFKTYDANNKETYIREKTSGVDAYYITAGQDSHDAINNILAKKGKTPANTNNVMDAAGNASLVEKIDFATDDFETYSKSSTGYEVTNQFNDTDWNRSDFVSNTVTYLSRQDWKTTYPKEAVKLRFHSDMLDALSYDYKLQEDPEAEMPLYEQAHQFNLIDMRGLEYDHEAWDVLLNQLSLEDMVNMMGSAYHGNGPIEHIANPGEVVYDGPLGVRRRYKTNGTDYITMSFPIAPLLAASFNAELANEVGKIKGEDILHTDLTGIYAPGANIHRTAYGGRAYEYYSEDGYLSGIMCKEETIGIQASGSVVNIKHFALNDQDDNRYGAAVWANEQSIREVYLEAFRPAVEEGDAWGIMSSFSRFGTKWAGAHYGLKTEVLRNEWGFDGYVISDCPFWTYMNIVDGLGAGTDCILYELSDSDKEAYYVAKESATVAQLIRQSAHRILYVIVNSNAMNGFTTNTRIIPVMTWWQITIIGLQVGFGILAAGSATMLVLSFVLKKKDNVVPETVQE